MDVGIWLFGRWILVGWMLSFGRVDGGFWLCGLWNLLFLDVLFLLAVIDVFSCVDI